MIDSKKVSIICSCYRGERYLDAFMENVARQTIIHNVELVLDHNEPSDQELASVSAFNHCFPGVMVHRIVRPVVSIYASWNNCITVSRGNYLCIWNVDDHRTPDSLERMCSTLDRHPEIGFTYGDFVVVDQLGQREGLQVHCPEFERTEFIRGMSLGPFFMWRAGLVSRVGYFDEQFSSGGDFDMAVRLAYLSVGKKIPGNLGFYLDAGEGASTGAKHLPGNIQSIERTAIELRYGLYDKTQFLNGYPYVQHARRYRLDQMLINGEWQPIERYVPNYRQMMMQWEPARRAFERDYHRWLIRNFPTWLSRIARRTTRRTLARLGLLGTVRALRNGR